MQTKRLHKNFRCLSGIDETVYSEIVWERKEKLELFDSLIEDGCTIETALRAIYLSRATYYRLKSRYKKYGLAGLENNDKKPRHVRTPGWNQEDTNLVCQIRQKYPLWGKDKVARILKRDHGINLSVSTVGRIVSKLVATNKIRSVSFYTGKYLPKPRAFTAHAQRLPMGAKSKKPGDLLQIDHTTAKLFSGKEVKHFEAICPITKVSVSKAYRSATSLNATDFLDFLLENLPFPIISIQVDGGCEFRGDFEQACKKRLIPLFVNPPRCPELNGCVERSHGTTKDEFYSLYNEKDNLEDINSSLQQYQQIYNYDRPHRSLQCLAPMEYYIQMGAF